MAIYPGALWGGNVRGTFMDDPDIHEKWHDDIQNEVKAMQAEVGLVPRGTYASVRARLDDWTIKTRLRTSRAASTYAAGDNPVAGTHTVVENVGPSGGFTGAGTAASPYVVPVAGTYLIYGFFNGF